MAKTYFVLGAKWHDKVNGNTYFNAKVYDGETGNCLFYTGYQYGYGSQYAYEARKMLVERVGNEDFKLVDLGALTMKKHDVKNGWF